MAPLAWLVTLLYLPHGVYALAPHTSNIASPRQAITARRGFLLASSLALLPAAPGVAAQPTPGTTRWSGVGASQVVLKVDGMPRLFDAMPLPPGFDKGLELPIRDITETVFGLPGSEEWAAAWPYTKEDMKRLDETDDASFYDAPRLVYHIDGGAVAALTHFYAETTPPKSDILDICSSWVSHYPASFPASMGRIAGTGMNALELQANAQLTGGFQQSDLNRRPALPFPDQSFDLVTCVVSVDYLTHPREVFREVARVLRPGGRFVLSQSNRLFYSKAVSKWLGLGDLGRLEMIGDYFRYAAPDGTKPLFAPPRAFDISAKGRNAKDPMFIVEAMRL